MEFYYQIKGKDSDEYQTGWGFPPIFSGKVTASNKKEAKSIIEREYEREFPLRVLRKDIESNEFLLSIQEMDKSSRYHKLFEINTCIVCGEKYRVIDKYNDFNCRDKSAKVCSDECKDEEYKVRRIQWNEENVMNGKHLPIIYKITNKKSLKVYIGKTTQVFTLRWYQHFFQGGSNKFHKEIKKTELTDWNFEVLEVIKVSSSLRFTDVEQEIRKREQHYIDKYNSINEGFNSVISIGLSNSIF